MSAFPVFMEMEDETCLIVGGGRVAYPQIFFFL